MDIKKYYVEEILQALIDLLSTDQQYKLENQIKTNRKTAPPVEKEESIWSPTVTDSLRGSI